MNVVSTASLGGLPADCPVCGASVFVEPCWPGGDAPCPCCGTLLWPDLDYDDTLAAEGRRCQATDAPTRQAVHTANLESMLSSFERLANSVRVLGVHDWNVVWIEQTTTSTRRLLESLDRPHPSLLSQGRRLRLFASIRELETMIRAYRATEQPVQALPQPFERQPWMTSLVSRVVSWARTAVAVNPTSASYGTVYDHWLDG